MSGTPEDQRPQRDLLAPMGVVLILSGIVVVVLAAITTPWVATAGLALVPSGIWLIVLSECRDEAEFDSTRFGGL
jgi:uncharacterized membrane protein HdeD (DUF308 family)